MATDKQVRLYQNFSEVIDPAHIFTLSDMDFSYALASTLVEWDSSKQIAGGVAESWQKLGTDRIQFKIRKDLKWSDESPLQAGQIKECFDRILKNYPDELRSLQNQITAITVTDSANVVFTLAAQTAVEDFLAKLTEPNFGITRTDAKGKLQLGTSTGAFFIRSNSATEITLQSNRHWHRYDSRMPEGIIIRKPADGQDITQDFASGRWSNLLEVPSIQSKDFSDLLSRNKVSIWKRPVDKLLFISPKIPSPSNNSIEMLRAIGAQVQYTKIMDGLAGALQATHVFPSGYDLHVSAPAPKNLKSEIPNLNRAPVVVYTKDRLHPKLVENLANIIETALKIKPVLKGVSVNELDDVLTKSDYDLVIGNVGMADPHADGVMSYYLESPIPVIQSPDKSLIAMLDKARSLKGQAERITAFKEILDLAVQKHWFLPLAHYSTVGYGRDGIDLSTLSESDESVTWSKIRFTTGAPAK